MTKRGPTLFCQAAIVAALVGPAEAPAESPRCFGAADRDPARPCENPRLRLRVTPTPQKARLTPNLACTRQRLSEVMDQCAFGVRAEEARETVAILGDSHAAHWRPALAVVAKAKRWRVLEVATPHCPLSTAMPTSAGKPVEWCPEWNRQVVEWLGEHPEVKTVFISAHTRAPIVVPDGRTRFQTRIDGFVEAWSRLPASVTRIIVIRDNPIDRVTTHDCVRRAVKRRRSPGRACAVTRRHALVADAGVVAAEQLRSRGTQVVDLSAHFCDRKECLPVVGGVLVHRDVDHLTQLFARTLGPYLLRAIR